jgi:hypothetical protein
VADRYFDMIAGVTKELGLYTQIYGEIFGREVVDRELNPLPSYMLPMALASSDGFAMFARIMTRPDPGSYTIEAGTKYARVLEDTDGFGGIQPNPDFEIGVGAGEGRFINNDYDFSQDYFWSDYQTRVGSTYEKRLAMDFLLEAYNRFVSIDRRDFIDGRWKNINYATLYPEQMRRLFSSIMQGDVTTFGPYYLPSTGGASKGTPVPRVNYPSWHTVNPNGSTDLVYPSDAVVIEPLFGWEQQFPSLISAFIYGPTTLTMDWYDQMRIFVEGGDEAVSVNGKTIRFEDPESTIVYVARDYGSEVVNGKAVPRNSGGRMLRFANDLRKEAYELSGDAVVLDSAGRPKVANAKAAQRLRRYVANLAVVRQLTSGYGPLGLGRE